MDQHCNTIICKLCIWDKEEDGIMAKTSCVKLCCLENRDFRKLHKLFRRIFNKLVFVDTFYLHDSNLKSKVIWIENELSVSNLYEKNKINIRDFMLR